MRATRVTLSEPLRSRIGGEQFNCMSAESGEKRFRKRVVEARIRQAALDNLYPRPFGRVFHSSGIGASPNAAGSPLANR